MSYGDTKIVINSITYDNCDNKILIGVRKHPETEDSQTAEVVLDNSNKGFTSPDVNLRGLSAVISYDFGSGYTAMPALRVMTQDDITIGGRYQTVLNLIGIPDLLAEDKASKDYQHDATDTKTVKSLLTEVLDGQPVASEVTASQTSVNAYYNLDGTLHAVGQKLWILNRTVKSIQFYLKKVGSPTGSVTFYIVSTGSGILASKVWGDASTLSTVVAWCTATLTTATAIDDEVYLYCEYTDGTTSNYVAVGYKSTDVVADQELVLLYATGSGDMSPVSDQDCGYQYTYDIVGVDCFSHCTAYTATFDSDDALIGVYTPKGTFKISEGESRLDVVNRLLDYTACFKRVESNNAVHFFVIPTSGNSYTSDTGDFYNHQNRKALVTPNRIVVKSYDDDDGYSGAATSAASYALLPITGSPIRAYVTNSTQAGDLAGAMMSRLEVNAQVGSVLVPMVNYEQAWNYVTITNNWNSSTTTGNIAYLNRVSMGGLFQQFISFGKYAKSAYAPILPKRQPREVPVSKNTALKWGDVEGLFSTIDENENDLFDNMNLVFLILKNMGVDIDFLERGVTFTWVYSAILANLASYYSKGQAEALFLALTGGTMSGAIAMGSNKITGLAAASANGDALRYEQLVGVYQLLGEALLLAGGTMAGAIAMGTNKITGLGAGTVAGDAVRYEQALLLAGGTMTGNLTMGTKEIKSIGLLELISGVSVSSIWQQATALRLQGEAGIELYPLSGNVQVSSDILPSSGDALDLGNATTQKFQEAHVNKMFAYVRARAPHGLNMYD